MERSRGLDGGALKGIAAALMLTDHVGAILLPEVPVLRCVGRLAFPIFAFFIAEGYAHTRDFGRYFRRLAIFAVVSEIPFNLENGAVFDPARQNVLFTFCLALLTLRGLEALGRERGFGRWAGCGLVLAAGFALRGRLDSGALLGLGVVLAIGVPAALGSFLMSVSSILMNGQMARYGDMAVAGVGVAMGNAADSVKEQADMVCPSVDDDGILWAVNKLLASR